jgi:hypothetical protein
MTEMPDFPVRDLKLEAIARLALENWDYPKVRTSKLEPVLASFRSNCNRVRFLMSLPTSLVGAATLTQREHDLAELEVTGGLLKQGSLSQDDEKQVEILRISSLNAHERRLVESRDDQNYDADALQYHLNIAAALRGYAERSLGAMGFLEWFSAKSRERGLQSKRCWVTCGKSHSTVIRRFWPDSTERLRELKRPTNGLHPGWMTPA